MSNEIVKEMLAESAARRMKILERIISLYAYHHSHAYHSELDDRERAIVDGIEKAADWVRVADGSAYTSAEKALVARMIVTDDGCST